MTHNVLSGFRCGLAGVLILLGSAQAMASDVSQAIASALAAKGGTQGGNAVPGDLEASAILPKFYEQRGFRPAWEDPLSIEMLFAELNSGVAQGFRPDDFYMGQLQELYAAAQFGNTEAQAEFDILATAAAVTLVHHTVFGKVDPVKLDSTWNFSRPVIQNDPSSVLNDYIDGAGFSELMHLISLRNRQYDMLVDALARYSQIRASGGWPAVPDANVLKPGDADPAVAALRQRLSIETGWSLGASAEGANVYDPALVDAVKAFQSRHGLNADGVIGGKTFASLNRTVDDRISKIRLSLERGRWLLRDLEGMHVIVNIAGARTYLVDEERTVWATRSITGSQYRKTPVFRDDIRYMEFNPTWTVPVSILKADKLPKIRQDVSYLDRNGYSVRNSSGEVISPTTVNWSADNPGVTLVQKPGPSNALGLVKFMFPNEHAVYLHDTDNRSLFDQNERNLSSGCVRLEHPFEFANLLMEGDPNWSRARMQSILDSGKTTRVDLPEPVPVLLTYWTAWVEEGQVHFREDPYERDGPLLQALDG